MFHIIDVAQTYSTRLNKMPRNVRDKLKMVTPAVAFSENTITLTREGLTF